MKKLIIIASIALCSCGINYDNIAEYKGYIVESKYDIFITVRKDSEYKILTVTQLASKSYQLGDTIK